MPKQSAGTNRWNRGKKRLEALLLKQPNTQLHAEKESAKSLSATCTERTRIITQDIAWREQQTAKRTKATAEMNRIKELKEQKIREEEERHKAQIEAMTNDFDQYIEEQQTIINKSNEDEEEHRKVVEEDLRKIN